MNRKSKEELREEAGLTNKPETPDGFEAFTDQEISEVNELFQMLHDNGWITAGDYQLSSDEQGRKVVTLSAILPSTLEHDRI